jgi:hypothetical protein
MPVPTSMASPSRLLASSSMDALVIAATALQAQAIEALPDAPNAG